MQRLMMKKDLSLQYRRHASRDIETIQVQVWLSNFTVHLKLPQHFKSAISQHKIKSLKFGKRDTKRDTRKWQGWE